MISHVSVGVRDLVKSGKFYDTALAPLGYKRLFDSAEGLGYGAVSPELWVMRVDRPVAADAASGLHFCLEAPSRASVDQFHAEGVKAGGKDNGKPGLRKDYGDNYYAAFVVDPDGYRLEAYSDK
ncbi:MAG TPA: VOC family protein [Candidatus Binataceae bacterium]|jgi:catechol 2,3-dioxygenase-like lactoylglutathione lyase family enzyme|nr:VOC family protein [Candidatus Binataceae bacterium]